MTQAEAARYWDAKAADAAFAHPLELAWLSALAPDLPTMAESGYPGFEAVPWFGLLAPSGTPQEVIDKIHDETVKVMALPEVRKQFADLGIEAVGNTPAEFAAIIKKETPAWAKVIKDADIKLAN